MKIKINSELDLFANDFYNICMLSDCLTHKLKINKLKKEDRELLLDTIGIIKEIKENMN